MASTDMFPNKDVYVKGEKGHEEKQAESVKEDTGVDARLKKEEFMMTNLKVELGNEKK